MPKERTADRGRRTRPVPAAVPSRVGGSSRHGDQAPCRAFADAPRRVARCPSGTPPATPEAAASAVKRHQHRAVGSAMARQAVGAPLERAGRREVQTSRRRSAGRSGPRSVGTARALGTQRPEEPNPPAPRSSPPSGSSSTTTSSGAANGTSSSWAIRSPADGRERLGPVVDQDHAQLAAVVRVDQPGRVHARDAVPDRQPGAGKHEPRDARGDRDRDAGRHHRALARREREGLDAREVVGRVARTRAGGRPRGGVQEFDRQGVDRSEDSHPRS